MVGVNSGRNGFKSKTKKVSPRPSPSCDHTHFTLNSDPAAMDDEEEEDEE